LISLLEENVLKKPTASYEQDSNFSEPLKGKQRIVTYRGCLLDWVALAASCLDNSHLNETGDECERGECKDN